MNDKPKVDWGRLIEDLDAMGSKPGMRNANAKHINFAFMAGCIPGKPTCIPSDLDMDFEHNGYFIVGEWKQKGVEELSDGQRIMLEAHARTPHYTVVLVTYEGPPEDPSVVGVVQITGETDYITLKEPADNEWFRNFFTKWYEWVENRTRRT